ncbi:hypothetical protein P280DRAFT_441420 [Massarina eburnea CBS 473.64]|uniref:Rhodopsin domain-containing protein n=1 Tax=Massarina eburnea CBS 473.64 TaxID=1395130 RepID=A0A6A6SH98_9PLEO|nr:hypothetical protein P280DRAFT_441420 [Massarina eburnea CBS 473.64]
MDLSQIPLAPPPPGVMSNFINPPNLMAAVIAGTVIIQTLVLPFLLTRIFVNVVSRTFRTEDLLCYTAWAAMVVQASLVVYVSSTGAARHAWNVSLVQIGPINRYYNYILCMWTISGYFGRTFIFLQFKRIFTTAKKGRVYWVIVLSIVANTLLYAAFLFSYIFSCWPREKIWNPMVPGRCLSTNKLQLATGILNIISDVECLLVPLWAIWQLQMKMKHKLQVFAVFSVGTVAIAIACAGLYMRIVTGHSSDFTWPLTQLAMVCMAELGSIIIVGCAPYLPRLLRWKQLRSQASYSAGRGYSDKSSKKQASSSPSKYEPSRQTSEVRVAAGEEEGRNEPLRVHPYYADGRTGERRGHEGLGDEGL